MSDLRSLVREVLTEELGKLRGSIARIPAVSTEEVVSLTSDEDLFAFVRRILEFGQNPAQRAALLEGRHRFRFGSPGAQPIQPPSPNSAVPGAAITAPSHHTIAKGLITERDIGLLPAGTRSVSVTAKSRLTPLAKDELRRLNISVERSAA